MFNFQFLAQTNIKITLIQFDLILVFYYKVSFCVIHAGIPQYCANFAATSLPDMRVAAKGKVEMLHNCQCFQRIHFCMICEMVQ